MSVEISNLPELVAQLTTSDFTPVVHNGTTYKHKTASYFVRKSENETITGVKTFSSSPIVPTATTGTQAVNKTQMDAAISAKATPLSNLNRVMQINGDGIPIFPDNVAGRTYWQDDWATTDGWDGSGDSTLTVSGGKLISTVATGKTTWRVNKSFAIGTNKIYRVKIKSTKSGNVGVLAVVDGAAIALLSEIPITAGIEKTIDYYISGNVTQIQWRQSGISPGDFATIDTIYIGSGLYNTPVYDKACCNSFTNNGVLPVPAPRGLGMAFNKTSSLVADNPVVGQSGTIGFKFKRNVIGTTQEIFSNLTGTASGFVLSFTSANVLRLAIANGSAYGYGTYVVTDTSSWHSFVMSFNSSAIIYYVDGVAVETISSPQVMAIATAVLKIGASGTGFEGNIAEPFCVSNIMTANDVTRYHNGDDAVDSQQKSSTGTPHALAVYGANGELKAHAGATVIDSSNIYSYVRPIGDVYFQGLNDADPATLYPGTIWTDVSWEEANMTRRVAGSLAGTRFTGVPARLTVTVSGGVPTITITSGGSGYLSGGTGTLPLTIAGSCTTQMAATANVTSGVVVSITVNTAGVGYTSGAVAVYDRVASHGDLVQKHRHIYTQGLSGTGTGGSGAYDVGNGNDTQRVGDLSAADMGTPRVGVETSGAWATVTKWRRTA